MGIPLLLFEHFRDKPRNLLEELVREYARAKAREEEKIRREREQADAGERKDYQEQAKSRSYEKKEEKTTNDSHQQKKNAHSSNTHKKKTEHKRDIFFDDKYKNDRENVRKAYEVLGLDPTGSYSRTEIMTAYKEQSLKSHPDLNGGGQNDIMQVLNRARDIVLKNI